MCMTGLKTNWSRRRVGWWESRSCVRETGLDLYTSRKDELIPAPTTQKKWHLFWMRSRRSIRTSAGVLLLNRRKLQIAEGTLLQPPECSPCPRVPTVSPVSRTRWCNRVPCPHPQGGDTGDTPMGHPEER
jgi:hypothetical protein